MDDGALLSNSSRTNGWLSPVAAADDDDVDSTVMLASTWLYRRRRNNLRSWGHHPHRALTVDGL